MVFRISEDNNKSKSKIRNWFTVKYPNLLPLWMAVFIDILGFSILLTILPSFIGNIIDIPVITGLILSINAIFTFIFAPILGKLSDRYGRKPILLISQLGTAIGFLLMAFSTSLELLIISRIIDGVFGGNFPIAKAIISDSVPPKDRALQMTNIGVCHVLASLIGPGLGGILYNFRGLLMLPPGLVSTFLSILTIIITIFLLKETWNKSDRLKNSQNKDKNDVKIRKNKTAIFLLVQWALHTISFMIYITTIALFASVVLGLTAFETGVLLSISGIFRAIIRFTIFKPLLKVLGENKMLLIGLGMFSIVFLLMGFVQNYIQFLIILLFVSFAASCTRGILISKITRSVSPHEQGIINGYMTSLDSIAQIIGPIFGGTILTVLPSYWLGILTSILASIAFIMLFKKVKLRS
ncbi:MAG: MFS transporter [Candidatus Lokiarchaeota archaeon]|nr:MFS transporter [Candidatus Lokiarchaeota archaeon]